MRRRTTFLAATVFVLLSLPPLAQGDDEIPVRVQRITDISLQAGAIGRAYFEASSRFSTSYKKEKWEPLITTIGRLSQTAIWLDRQPFQNGDKYYSVILKIPQPSRNLLDYIVPEFRRSRGNEMGVWFDTSSFRLIVTKLYSGCLIKICCLESLLTRKLRSSAR